jgi:hypothetical protein
MKVDSNTSPKSLRRLISISSEPTFAPVSGFWSIAKSWPRYTGEMSSSRSEECSRSVMLKLPGPPLVLLGGVSRT